VDFNAQPFGNLDHFPCFIQVQPFLALQSDTFIRRLDPILHGINASLGHQLKERLILELMSATAEIAVTDPSHVQVYIVDVPARQIAEWGRLLPLPGEEAAWNAATPDHVRKRMDDLLG
jgi:phenylpyruvate tautomerase PptA (4-oxalocrotonate tautomerase family)